MLPNDDTRQARRGDSEQSGDQSLIRCERLVIGHRGRALLPACDLEIRRGDFVVVVGRNGSGKTTFFRTLLGLLSPVSGRVVRSGPQIRSAYVAQAIAVDRTLPLRARDIVGWGRLSGWSFLRIDGQATRAACDRALADAGAADLADLPFRDLSEGQKQRVLLARALAARPDVAFLDEPTSAMDVIAEEETVAHLAAVARERGMGVVVISHMIRFAARYANKVVFLDRDDGVILTGAPATVLDHAAFRRQFGSAEVA